MLLIVSLLILLMGARRTHFSGAETVGESGVYPCWIQL